MNNYEILKNDQELNNIIDAINRVNENAQFSKELFTSSWKKGITFPILASKYLGCNCIFKLNGKVEDLT